ncbi:DUF983 domain-containing protein [Parapedobacter indicus]|uniref:DUF983 domain-containing protein n=1 Tax=Parapedobacter indicus TaxID=1477437 RepID=A0A1I3N813_9SPHI|nr:DUF983 domain-containing protein [Parapedobacter indicus]PPL00908.1 uncharacterized protein DUF983 [Parapedobacter indicus]SFJ05404.1 Protein of unknown function [Parapedobacter indicus]
METTQEISEFKAALHAKCPRCRTGALFTGRAYGLKAQKMNEYCPHCQLKFEQRPGHFYVSMFVSYALSVAEMVIACLATYLITKIDDSFWLYLTVAISAALLFAPFNYRYSRVILLFWLTPGFHYQPETAKGQSTDR